MTAPTVDRQSIRPRGMHAPPPPADPRDVLHEGTVYLLHFSRRYEHAGHYLGWTSDLDARLVRHHAGRGARLVQVVEAEGITVECMRTWRGTRYDERRLKGRGQSDLCPVCAATQGRTLRSPRWLTELHRSGQEAGGDT